MLCIILTFSCQITCTICNMIFFLVGRYEFSAIGTAKPKRICTFYLYIQIETTNDQCTHITYVTIFRRRITHTIFWWLHCSQCHFQCYSIPGLALVFVFGRFFPSLSLSLSLGWAYGAYLRFFLELSSTQNLSLAFTDLTECHVCVLINKLEWQSSRPVYCIHSSACQSNNGAFHFHNWVSEITWKHLHSSSSFFSIFLCFPLYCHILHLLALSLCYFRSLSLSLAWEQLNQVYGPCVHMRSGNCHQFRINK